jgi:hypothetical protein
VDLQRDLGVDVDVAPLEHHSHRPFHCPYYPALRECSSSHAVIFARLLHLCGRILVRECPLSRKKTLLVVSHLSSLSKWQKSNAQREEQKVPMQGEKKGQSGNF